MVLCRPVSLINARGRLDWTLGVLRSLASGEKTFEKVFIFKKHQQDFRVLDGFSSFFEISGVYAPPLLMAITHSPAFTQTSRGIIKAAETSLVMPECPHNIGGPSGTIREPLGAARKKSPVKNSEVFLRKSVHFGVPAS
jgi:hypothetical protein